MRLERFLVEGWLRSHKLAEVAQANHLSPAYCGRSLFSLQLGWFEYAMPGYGS